MSRKTKGLQAQNHPFPIPEREQMLGVLEEAGVPMTEEQILEKLGVAPEEREGAGRRIAAMERDGQIHRNRRGLLVIADKAGLIKGKVIGHPDGFGFLQPEDGTDDLFLGPKQMHTVLHGDIALARVTGFDRKGRREGSIVEVLERANSKVVGRLFIEHGVMFVIAENKRLSQDILITPEGSLPAKAGQVVVAEILSQPTKNAEPIGRVIEVLGNYADPGMEIEIALRKHDLPHEFPASVEKAASLFPATVPASDLKGRKDLRDLDFVTIDGETARDFDDAVYAEKIAKGWKLWVAIADVSHYVKPGDALDKEARERGNSVYFPRRVIPMLPEALSNELCSLKPKVDRLVMVCEMEILPSGSLKKYSFYPGVIHSKARLTYTRVAAVLEGREADPPVEAALVPSLETLYGLYKSLLGSRNQRGAIDFDSVETQMIFDDKGKIEKIVRVQRNDAHRLIEECMLAANVCASDFLQENGQPTLYRIHEGPTPEKLEALRSMLKDFALSLAGGDEPQAKDYQQLLSRIKGKPFASLLQTVMLRSLRQAVYSPENVGHFGLAYEAYAHFTSPIRRYPDLLVHRGIKSVLKKKLYEEPDWHAIGNHCSETERRADEATRDVENWLKSYYMQDHVGDEFEGTISGVTNFGLFVTLDEMFVDGLVHISDLGQDYFTYDQARHTLKGERSGVKYQLGGHVRIKVVRVDIEAAKIDFTLVGQPVPAVTSMGKAEKAPKPRDIDKKAKKHQGKYK
ncbi:Ribonuclease R [Usitatibacter rugosus]|uniref:Ribonuclease R n=1 Tax=Usitatibacter rugosus TaxID=2732067 RepID=A0A6M4GYZ0_9PROT|nr:ribonuclease R [Usitatibacter rugosus]QJR11734.1 Ribonuclease R [Usitatibacter rugosus]